MIYVESRPLYRRVRIIGNQQQNHRPSGGNRLVCSAQHDSARIHSALCSSLFHEGRFKFFQLANDRMTLLAQPVGGSYRSGVGYASLKQAKIRKTVEYYRNRSSTVHDLLVKCILQYFVVMRALLLFDVIHDIIEALLGHLPEEREEVLPVAQRISDARLGQKL